MFAWNKDAVTLTSTAQLAFVVLLLLCLAVVVGQLAFVGKTIAYLELHLVLNQTLITFHTFC